MKNSILLTFMMLFASVGIIFAQPNSPDFYTGNNRIKGDNYDYIILETMYGLKVSNALNTIITTKPPQLPENLWWGTASYENKDAENYFKMIAAKEIQMLSQEYREERSKPQKETFTNNISAMIAVNPRTGQILEVYFGCHNTPATKAIHPDKFYQLEQFIKQNIKISVEVFSSNEAIQNQLLEREWILTKIPFKVREMYPL